MIKQLVVGLAALTVLLTILATTQQAHADAYGAGWRDGYAAHVKGGPYFALSISRAYSQGYQDGWDAWGG